MDVHKALSPGKDKMVPIHMAARYGQLQILKLLIQNEARVEAKGQQHQQSGFTELDLISLAPGENDDHF